VKKLDTVALVLTGVGGLNWGLVGLSAAYLLSRIPALMGGRERLPAAS
jgi:uncharacterized membrane protein YuzA (DUF378 family)